MAWCWCNATESKPQNVVRNVRKTRRIKKKMKNLFFIISILFTLSSCNFSKKENKVITKKEKIEATKSNNDSVIVPAFEIQLNLSEKAEKKLREENETVIIEVEFIGDPKEHILENKKYEIYDENGQLTIGSKRVELKKERNVKFKNCKVSNDLLQLLENKNYDIRINTFSGRKSSEDNLLDCDYFEDNIENVKNQIIVINGKLIYGE